MKNGMVSEYKIDPLFERLIQPMDEKAKKELKDRIISEPGSSTIDIWNGYYLNDEFKYKQCIQMGLPVQIKDHDFSNQNYAGAFICTEQLKREDLTNEYKKYLIGQKFLFEEHIYTDDHYGEKNVKGRVSFKIGEEFDVVGGTVLKYCRYADAINSIFDQNKTFALRILLNQTRVSHENVLKLSRLKDSEIEKIALSVIENDTPHLVFQDIRRVIKNGQTRKRSYISQREGKGKKKPMDIGIRQMPVYNPDSDVNSLCMTIGSWVSSMERVNRTVDYSLISRRATLELMKQLTILEGTIGTLQKSLIERDENDE